MPKHDTVSLWNLFGSFNNKLRYLLKMPKKLEFVKGTYFLPVGTSLGFMSLDLKAANHNSIGETL